MTLVDRLAQGLTSFAALTGAYAPLVLFFASFIEYVFPPFPGDTIVLLGAWYAVQGQLSWPVTFLAVTAGALAGAFVDYRVGVRLGRGLERSGARRRFLGTEQLRAFEAGYRRWGALFLLLNRFLPGVRAFLFVAAGASGIPLSRVLFYGGISAAAWNALLLVAGAALARNMGDLGVLFGRYTRISWGLLAAVAVVVAGRALWKRKGRTP